jgi:HSP20 family protein
VTSQRDLFANFERMRREIDELFGQAFEGRPGLRGRGFSPRVDVYYTDNPPRAVVKVDLAAVDPADVALEIRGR